MPKHPQKLWYVYSAGGGFIGTVTAATKAAALRKARYQWGSSSEMSDADLKRMTVRANRGKTRKRATSRRKKNPVRVSASLAGKSTGWMPAKAVRVVRGKGGKVRVDVKK